ncbi:MAG TPA: hypothetical protein VFH11_12720 [Gemmatimonadota bacterium]|nr:hypothetical protein [Gemmatimonadota bacterium]
MRQQVDVIALLRQANPVPPGAVEENVDRELILHSVMERAESMAITVDAPSREPTRRNAWTRVAAAVAGLAAVIAVAVPLIRPAGQIVFSDVPADRQQMVIDLFEAVNGRDAAGFARLFADGATFRSQEVEFVDADAIVPSDDPELVAAWMAVFEAWDTEFAIQTCRMESEGQVVCEGREFWHAVQVEMGSQWALFFDGERLVSAGQFNRELELPSDERTLALSWLDLTGAMTATGSHPNWKAWIAENDPDMAARLEASTGELTVDGHRFVSNLFEEMDPSLVPEIADSVERYLASR